MRAARILVGGALVFGSIGASFAATVSSGVLECLPNEANTSASAQVTPEISGSQQVRLYFRRLNRGGAYYWVEMNPKGDGNYWSVFPKPENRDQGELTDEWWEILKDRDWMAGHDRDWLGNWLEDQEHEASEYYVSVTDVTGKEIARSSTQLAPIVDRDNCEHGMNVRGIGQARNLVVGETTALQEGKEVFHWLCDGIVTRVNSDGVLRGDETCRACVVAGWAPVAATAGALVIGTTIEKREPRRASNTQPQ